MAEVGQSMNLFDFNWGTTSVSFPAPIQAMVAMGQEVGSCLSNSGLGLPCYHAERCA